MAKAILMDLAAAIQTTTHPLRLEELLQANDELTAAMAATTSGPPQGRPALTLQGLGIHTSNGDASVAGEQDPSKDVPNGNGQAVHSHSTEGEELEDVEDPLSTPRIDKGKARAEPEPPEVEKVLSPTFMIESEDEDEDDDLAFRTQGGDDEAVAPSPTDRWVCLLTLEDEICDSASQIEELGCRRRRGFPEGQCALGPRRDGRGLRRRAVTQRGPLCPSFTAAGSVN
jgi:protein phosphatase 1 regulatory subunit 37